VHWGAALLLSCHTYGRLRLIVSRIARSKSIFSVAAFVGTPTVFLMAAWQGRPRRLSPEQRLRAAQATSFRGQRFRASDG
jgi:hypothetical protein